MLAMGLARCDPDNVLERELWGYQCVCSVA